MYALNSLQETFIVLYERVEVVISKDEGMKLGSVVTVSYNSYKGVVVLADSGPDPHKSIRNKNQSCHSFCETY